MVGDSIAHLSSIMNDTINLIIFPKGEYVKNAIIELLKKHKALTGREIGEVVDPIEYGNRIHTALEELVKEGKIIQNPLKVKEWDTYTWSLNSKNNYGEL